MKNSFFNKRSFTLLELMVVIVLISIIAGFAIPNYAKSVRKARQRDALLQITGLHAALTVYFSQARQYWNPGGGGTTSDIDAINTALGTNLIANDMTFTYSYDSDTEFTADATWDDTSAANNDFSVYITEEPLSGSNPCCCPIADPDTCEQVLPDCSSCPP